MNGYFEKQSRVRAEKILSGLELPPYAVARMLRKFHAAASSAIAAIEMKAGEDFQNKTVEELREWLIPLDPPEPIFDRAVWRASATILDGLNERSLTAVDGLLPALQQLFEEGRKIGSTGQTTREVDRHDRAAEDVAKKPDPDPTWYYRWDRGQ